MQNGKKNNDSLRIFFATMALTLAVMLVSKRIAKVNTMSMNMSLLIYCLTDLLYKINIYKPEENFVEQSSENIWQSVCASVKDAISIANIDINKISGIGFDATCSLVVLDKNGKLIPFMFPVDWKATREMWQEKPETKEQKKLKQKSIHLY